MVSNVMIIFIAPAPTRLYLNHPPVGFTCQGEDGWIRSRVLRVSSTCSFLSFSFPVPALNQTDLIWTSSASHPASSACLLYAGAGARACDPSRTRSPRFGVPVTRTQYPGQPSSPISPLAIYSSLQLLKLHRSRREKQLFDIIQLLPATCT